jgi:hypothetical protein
VHSGLLLLGAIICDEEDQQTFIANGGGNGFSPLLKGFEIL